MSLCTSCKKLYCIILSRINHSSNRKVWQASRDADVMNHDLGAVRRGYFHEPQLRE